MLLGMTMSPRARPSSFRFPDALLARIDAYAEQLSLLAGVKVTRAAAAGKLLALALDQVEAEAKKKRKR